MDPKDLKKTNDWKQRQKKKVKQWRQKQTSLEKKAKKAPGRLSSFHNPAKAVKTLKTEDELIEMVVKDNQANYILASHPNLYVKSVEDWGCWVNDGNSFSNSLKSWFREFSQFSVQLQGKVKPVQVFAVTETDLNRLCSKMKDYILRTATPNLAFSEKLDRHFGYLFFNNGYFWFSEDTKKTDFDPSGSLPNDIHFTGRCKLALSRNPNTTPDPKTQGTRFYVEKYMDWWLGDYREETLCFFARAFLSMGDKYFLSLVGGRNSGKSSFLKVIRNAFENLYGTMDHKYLWAEKGLTGTHWIEDFCCHKKVVFVNEIDDVNLNGTLIKQLQSGGADEIQYHVNGKSVKGIPKAKLVLCSNKAVRFDPVDTNQNKLTCMFFNVLITDPLTLETLWNVGTKYRDDVLMELESIADVENKVKFVKRKGTSNIEEVHTCHNEEWSRYIFVSDREYSAISTAPDFLTEVALYVLEHIKVSPEVKSYPLLKFATEEEDVELDDVEQFELAFKLIFEPTNNENDQIKKTEAYRIVLEALGMNTNTDTRPLNDATSDLKQKRDRSKGLVFTNIRVKDNYPAGDKLQELMSSSLTNFDSMSSAIDEIDNDL